MILVGCCLKASLLLSGQVDGLRLELRLCGKLKLQCMRWPFSWLQLRLHAGLSLSLGLELGSQLHLELHVRGRGELGLPISLYLVMLERGLNLRLGRRPQGVLGCSVRGRAHLILDHKKVLHLHLRGARA